MGGLRRAREPRQAVAPEDRFVLASATKLATACLVAQLAERGVLASTTRRDWLPELPHAGRLTPRLLLAHRSGLREYTQGSALARRCNGGAPDHPWSRGEVIAAIARLGTERAPDRRFAYRNSNYVVAAEMAERAERRATSRRCWMRSIAGPLGLPGFSFARSVAGRAWRRRTWRCSAPGRPARGHRRPRAHRRARSRSGATAASRAARRTSPASPRRCSAASS